MSEYMNVAMHAFLREAEIHVLRNFKIPKVGKELANKQLPQVAIIIKSLEPRPDFLVLPNNQASAPKTTQDTVQQLIRSISPNTHTIQRLAQDETLQTTNMLASMNEEPLPPTPGIRDEYENISSTAVYGRACNTYQELSDI